MNDSTGKSRQPLAETNRTNQSSSKSNTKAAKDGRENARSSLETRRSTDMKREEIRPKTAPSSFHGSNSEEDAEVGHGTWERKVARNLQDECDQAASLSDDYQETSDQETNTLTARPSLYEGEPRAQTRFNGGDDSNRENSEDEELREFESIERKIAAGLQESGAIQVNAFTDEEGAMKNNMPNDEDGEDIYDEDAEEEPVLNTYRSNEHIEYGDDEEWSNDAETNAGLTSSMNKGYSDENNMIEDDINYYGKAPEGEHTVTRSSLVNKFFVSDEKGKSDKSLSSGNRNQQNKSQLKSPNKQKKVTIASPRSEIQKGKKQTAEQEMKHSGEQSEGASVEDKVLELENEIMEFRKQNEMLQKVRSEVESQRQALLEEKGGLSKNLHDAENRFEKYKEAEMKKLRKDRKDMERNVALWQQQVQDTRAERDSARKELQAAQEENSRKEKKLRSEIERLKKKVDDLMAKNEELARELKFSEEARLAIQDREVLIQAKAKLSKAKESTARDNSVPCMTPRSEETLASHIAQVAVDESNSIKILPDMQEKRTTALNISNDGTSIITQSRTDLLDETLVIDAGLRKQDSSKGSDEETQLVLEKQHADGKIEQRYSDGRRVLIFSNGTSKFLRYVFTESN